MNKRLPLDYIGLYGIVDLSFEEVLPPEKWTEILLKNGIRIIQLRAKKVSSSHFYRVAERLRKLIPDDYIFIINDRPDIALLVGAEGVHLGQDDLPLEKVKEKWNLIVGYSTHNIGQIKRAAEMSVDYVGFGPIFPTTSKDNPDPVVGIEELVNAVSISPHPVVAIGGIDRERLENILNRVCPKFFAVVSSIALSESPELMVRNLQNIYLEKCS